MRGNRKAQNSEPAKEKLHIGIFAGIAVLAFLLTAVFYGIGFFPFQPKILAPSGTHRRRNLYDRNFFFICQSRSCLCGIISFS